MHKDSLINNLHNLILQHKCFDFIQGKELLNYFRMKNIIIYGAGSAGKHLYQVLKFFNIKISFFIDKTHRSINNIDNIPVYSLDILELYKDKINTYEIIIAVNTKNLYDILENNLKIFNFNISYSYGLVINKIFSLMYCNEKFINNMEIDLSECFGCRSDMAQCEIFEKFAKKNNIKYKPRNTKKSKFNDLTYMITTKCTFNCEHCTLKIPYLNKYNISSDIVIRDIKKILENCDFINRLSLLGGELLLNRELPIILEKLLSLDKIGFIFIYTTGTVIPNDLILKLFSDKRISLNISDYGENTPTRNKQKLNDFLSLINLHNINHNILKNKTWFELGNFEYTGNKVKINTFESCPFYDCTTMINGKIYKCPHQLSGIELGKIPLVQEDIIDINKSKNLIFDLENFRKLKFIDACNYCNILVGAKEIPAAIQK